LRILWLNWRDIKHPWAGGAEAHLHEVSGRLAQQGHEITVISSWFPGLDREQEIDGYKVIRIGDSQISVSSVWTYFSSVWRMMRSVGGDYDAIIENTNKVPLYAWLGLSVSSRDRVLAIVHHLNGEVYFQELSRGKALLAYSLEHAMPYSYTRLFNIPILTVSESSRHELIALGSDPKMITTVRSGVDHEKYKPRTNQILKQKTSQPSILYLNRLQKYKQPQHALQAFKLVVNRIPDAKLIVAGTGEMLPDLMRLTDRLNITGNVEFKGYVNEADKIALMQQSWAHIQTSSKEGWGLTVAEAAACGTPSVVYKVAGLIESVHHGETGFLTNPEPNALAQKLITLVTNEELLERMSRNAHLYAKRFDWNDTCCELMQVIGTLRKTHPAVDSNPQPVREGEPPPLPIAA
jgi:glycosyltransferase involved in cell wall biosynthesis